MRLVCLALLRATLSFAKIPPWFVQATQPADKRLYPTDPLSTFASTLGPCGTRFAPLPASKEKRFVVRVDARELASGSCMVSR